MGRVLGWRSMWALLLSPCGLTLACSPGYDEILRVDESSIGVKRDGSSGGATDSSREASPGGPSAVSELVLTNQGGANNANNAGASSTHSQSIRWNAASPGLYPIDHYQIYRNAEAYATTVNLDYTDENATNSNDIAEACCAYNVPRTVYAYNVAAVDTLGDVGPLAPLLTYWEHKNGVDAWGDSTYEPPPPMVVMNWADTSIKHGASPSTISVTTNQSSEYISPYSAPPGVPEYSFESGAFVMGFMELDIYPTKANQTFHFGVFARVTIGSIYNNTSVTLGNNPGYGPAPMVMNAWNHIKVPMGKGTQGAPGLQMGFATFQGYIAGAVLTVTSVGDDQIQLSPGMWVSAQSTTDTTVPNYILGPGPSDTSCKGTGIGKTGTYCLNVSDAAGSADNPITFTGQRTNLYSWSMGDETNSGSNQWYLDNIEFTSQ